MIYAVNKRTKEHRRGLCVADLDDNWTTVDADADGWVPHDGGVCPLPDGAKCEYRMRDGNEDTAMVFALRWTRQGDDGDIIAYRPILDTKPGKPETPEWNGEGLPPAGIRCEALRSHGWVEVYVVGYCEDGYCVFDTGSDFKGNKDPNKFRPIRSEEDRAVEEMARIIADGHDVYIGAHEAAERLYRAGYRKTGGE